MKTNYQMIMTLNEEFQPQEIGIITGDEAQQVRDTLHLEEMDELQMRNLRDMVVMFFHLDGSKYTRERMDKLSAITAVIDDTLWRIGAEV